MSWISRTIERLRRGELGELNEASLRQEVVRQLVRFGAPDHLGTHQFPAVVRIRITVPKENRQVTSAWVNSERFDQAVAADLRNRLVGTPPEKLPIREYRISSSDRTTVEIGQSSRRVLAKLVVEGGDRDREVMELVVGRETYLLGRGPWHGPERMLANDVVISDKDRFVSRRTGALRRVGTGFELRAVDQGEGLAVVRRDGERVKPHLTRAGAAAVAVGDRIEIEGPEESIVLRLVSSSWRPEKDTPEDSAESPA